MAQSFLPILRVCMRLFGRSAGFKCLAHWIQAVSYRASAAELASKCEVGAVHFTPQPLLLAETAAPGTKGSQFGGTGQHLTLYIFISLRDVIGSVTGP